MTEPAYSGFLPGAHAIDGYGKGGFRFAGMSHRGSLLALPSGVRAWAPTRREEIDETSLVALFAEPKGAVEHLLVGTGTGLVFLSKPLMQRLREAGIRAEPMATGAAARTYSILLGERRRVAAALLAAD